MIKIYENVKEFDSLKDYWKENTILSEDPLYVSSDFEYIRWELENSDEKEKTLVIVFYDDVLTKPIIGCVCKIKNVNTSCNIGYFHLPIKIKKKCLLISRYGIIGKFSNEKQCYLFINNLLDFLKSKQLDYAYFTLLPFTSLLSGVLQNIKSPFITASIEPHFLLKVPENLEAFLSTKDSKSRSTLKRKIKKVETQFKGEVTIKVFSTREEVDEFIDIAESIMKKSHLRPLGVGFKKSIEICSKIYWLAEHNFFRGYVLLLKGIPCAFYNCILYKKRLYIEHLGFDLSYEKLSVGLYLLMKIISDIATTKIAEIIDYGFGSDEYKKRFSNIYNEDIRIKIVVPNFSNFFFIATITISSIINIFFKKIMQKVGLYYFVRKNIRKFLRKYK